MGASQINCSGMTGLICMMEASHLPYGENECAMVQSEFPIPYSITTAPHQVMNSIEAAM